MERKKNWQKGVKRKGRETKKRNNDEHKVGEEMREGGMKRKEELREKLQERG